MRGYNKAILIGNLTRDPELRYTINKRAYVRFGIAVNYSWKDQNGEFKEGTDFINVVAWGTIAENCGKYLKKGSGVFVEGRIQTGSYEAKDGTGKRYTTEILASTVQFVGVKKDDGGGGSYEGNREPQGRSKGTSVRDSGFSDEEFPTDFSEMDIEEGADPEIPF